MGLRLTSRQCWNVVDQVVCDTRQLLSLRLQVFNRSDIGGFDHRLGLFGVVDAAEFDLHGLAEEA